MNETKNDHFKVDEEISDLWQEGIREFFDKGGFARTFENKKIQYVKPSIELSLTSLEDVYEYPETEYLIHPLLVRGHVHLIGAAPGRLKTILTYSIVHSLVTGNSLWGKYPVKETGPVLIVDEESPKSLLKDHMRRMGFDKNLPLYFLHFQDIRLDIDEIFEALMWKIIEVNPIFIVFDSLVRLHRQKENDSIAMSTILAKFRRVANCGPTIWIVHHHKKGDSPLDEKARGSTDIIAGVDIEYRLVKKDGFYYLSSGKSRIEPFGPVKLKAEFTDTKIKITSEGTEKEDILSEVLDILDDDSLKAGEIHEKLQDRGVEVGINKVREILKSSPQITSIKTVKRGRAALYSLSENSSVSGLLHSLPPYKGGVEKESNDPILHGQPKNSDPIREVTTVDSQGLAVTSRVENEGGREVRKLGFVTSRAGVKNEGSREVTEGADFEVLEDGQITYTGGDR